MKTVIISYGWTSLYKEDLFGIPRFLRSVRFHSQTMLVGSKMGTLLGLTETISMKMYRTQHTREKPKALDRTLYKVAKYLAETVATSLGNVMEQLTVVLFDFH